MDEFERDLDKEVQRYRHWRLNEALQTFFTLIGFYASVYVVIAVFVWLMELIFG